MTNQVFAANEVVTIRGYQRDCECSHCGRPLKVGVLLETFPGAFGAQCLAKAFAAYTYNGKKYRHGADSIKERAVIAGKGVADRHNLNVKSFQFTLKEPLQSR